MIVRRLASRRLVKKGSTEQEPRRKRAARFLLVVFAAGAFSGLAAWLGVWPFGNIHTLIAEVFGSTGGPPQISATNVYPSVQPVHRTVDVYDPAAPRRAEPTQKASPGPSQSPGPSGSPRPTPPPDE